MLLFFFSFLLVCFVRGMVWLDVVFRISCHRYPLRSTLHAILCTLDACSFLL